jgi:hypothetical protein
MVLPPASVILFLVLGAVQPLSDGDRARLAGAAEGGDHREDAFAALVANAGQWTPGTGETPVRLHVDPVALLADPAANRGALVLVAGRLEQQGWLDPPDEATAEWFVRDDAGRPMLVYVCGLPTDHPFREGQRLTLPARFYKRVDDRARDGQVRGYAAFVGAHPQVTARGAATGQLWIVIVPVAIMLVVFLALLIYAHRGGRPPRTGVRLDAPPTGGGAPLPHDPAEALAELRRRAEGPGS